MSDHRIIMYGIGAATQILVIRCALSLVIHIQSDQKITHSPVTPSEFTEAPVNC